MRILIVSNTYAPAANGQSVFVTNLAEGLVRQGHRVAVATPTAARHLHGEVRNGVELTFVPALHLSSWHEDVYINLAPRRAIDGLVAAFRPDVVHIQDHYPLCWSAVNVARRRGLPVLGTNHFMPQNLDPYIPVPEEVRPWLHRGLWWWMMRLYNRLDVVTTQSRRAAAILREEGLRPPTHPVSCGIDLQRFRPNPALNRRGWCRRYGLDPERITLLFVGRLDGEKRLDTLFQALARLERDDVQLALAGKGAAQERLRILARRLGLGERVHFLGYVPGVDLPSLLNTADIFVMPSDAELLSIATLEAMACARPVLAARAQALPELVVEGVNGALFRPADPEDAARALSGLIEQRHRWPAMGAASRRRARAHEWTDTLRIYERIYASLLPASPQPDFFFPGDRLPVHGPTVGRTILEQERGASNTFDAWRRKPD